jgi:hypothetical protein
VTVKVDAVVFFNVIDPVRAVVTVQNYVFAVSQVAQTSLRSMIGKSELDDLLSNREQLNKGLELMIDNPALHWGIHIGSVALSVGVIETDLGGEGVEPSSPLAASEVRVRRVPVPRRGDRRRGPLVSAVQPLLSRRRRTAG